MTRMADGHITDLGVNRCAAVTAIQGDQDRKHEMPRSGSRKVYANASFEAIHLA